MSNANPALLKPLRSAVQQLSMWAGLDDDHLVRVGFRNRAITIDIPKLEKARGSRLAWTCCDK